MTTRKPRKTPRARIDSLEGRAAAFNAELSPNFTPGRSVPVPPNILLRDAAEEILWDQFTSARVPADWSPVDLLLIGKLVRL